MLYTELEAPVDVTFRTAVSTQRGLQRAQVATEPGLAPVRLVDRYPRPVR